MEGPRRYTTMTLATHEFIRRFLMHVLPKGLHRIRHYGLLANGNRATNLVRMRELLNEVSFPEPKPGDGAEMVKAEDGPPAMSVLRRADAHHRNLPGRRQAAHSGVTRRAPDRHLMNAEAGPRSPIPLFCHWPQTSPARARPGRSSAAHPAAASGSKPASRPDHRGERRLNSDAFRRRKAPKTAQANHRFCLNPHRTRGAY